MLEADHPAKSSMSPGLESDHGHGPGRPPPLERECFRDNTGPSTATPSDRQRLSAATSASSNRDRIAPVMLFFLAAGLAAVWSCASYFRWANFGYRTFDLAYYVQAVWQLIHWRFALTVENVPLLGNHVEPIVFIFGPILALVRHPMVFVVVQNVGLASMAPIGYLLARRFFDRPTSALLSLALLLAPATSFVALHEFHPEALSTPLLLLMIYSRTTRRLWMHWLSFLAVLACKENMALLLATYCLVFLVTERRLGFSTAIRWSGLPLLVAVAWFFLCTQIITPAFNSGNIDYLSLYDRLGKTPAEIVGNVISRPQLIGRALTQSLGQGNLVWGLLLPFGLLPLWRPRWLLISAPIFLQHLLSWRSSEWSIYFHYAAPLLPLMWMGAVEGLAMLRDRWHRSIENSRIVTAVALLLVFGCLASQMWVGPAPAIWSDFRNYSGLSADRARKQAFIARIPANASVVAPLSYLSHLAMREKLYSLHYILKGLKTLSRDRYQPPALPDFVLIDYDDTATFDPSAGYYHPQMQTVEATVIPSSDQLLHEFLRTATWTTQSNDSLTLLKKVFPKKTQPESVSEVVPDDSANRASVFSIKGNELQAIEHSDTAGGLTLELRWRVSAGRDVFPWMLLRLSKRGSPVKIITKGLCAIDAESGLTIEQWQVDLSRLPLGEYEPEAIFLDYTKAAWRETHGRGSGLELLAPPISLGRITVSPRRR
jgi:uncharacterized membrane protein